MPADWPPLPKRMPPPPRGDAGRPGFVEWVPADCRACGHTLAWRDQYLRLHCRQCDPPRPQRWRAIPEAPEPAEGPTEALPLQLSLF